MQILETLTHWSSFLASKVLYCFAMQVRCLSVYSGSFEQAVRNTASRHMLVELVADPPTQQALLKHLGETVFKGRGGQDAGPRRRGQDADRHI